MYERKWCQHGTRLAVLSEAVTCLFTLIGDKCIVQVQLRCNWLAPCYKYKYFPTKLQPSPHYLSGFSHMNVRAM